jgi:hypothetical protein
MIKEFEFYHGVVFSKLIHYSAEPISIKPYSSNSNASYIINDNIGIYIKHCTKRLTPWRFSFQRVHQDEILEMKNKLGQVYLALVCGEDGIVTLSFEELKKILDDTHGEVEWISAARNPNQEYTINGSDGGLGRKVGKSDFPKKIFNLDIINKKNEETLS